MSQAPSDVFEMTVRVVADAGSCVLRNDAPASYPSRCTASVDSWSQNPSP